MVKKRCSRSASSRTAFFVLACSLKSFFLPLDAEPKDLSRIYSTCCLSLSKSSSITPGPGRSLCSSPDSLRALCWLNRGRKKEAKPTTHTHTHTHTLSHRICFSFEGGGPDLSQNRLVGPVQPLQAENPRAYIHKLHGPDVNLGQFEVGS